MEKEKSILLRVSSLTYTEQSRRTERITIHGWIDKPVKDETKIFNVRMPIYGFFYPEVLKSPKILMIRCQHMLQIINKNLDRSERMQFDDETSNDYYTTKNTSNPLHAQNKYYITKQWILPIRHYIRSITKQWILPIRHYILTISASAIFSRRVWQRLLNTATTLSSSNSFIGVAATSSKYVTHTYIYAVSKELTIFLSISNKLSTQLDDTTVLILLGSNNINGNSVGFIKKQASLSDKCDFEVDLNKLKETCLYR
ncbi:hypothetical protein X798_02346 [Onchocerca flexuosa]|uniref:Uncharacterized protein n=1 Tax=Onchocerca flexuosa TaxID=387005 RepID=A0A238BZA4_9BILA|nr:hypothetical protein X798_02346 [Onchocerca flexuosa]